MKQLIPNSSIKAFLVLYKKGNGISNNQMNKLVPTMYKG